MEAEPAQLGDALLVAEVQVRTHVRRQRKVAAQVHPLLLHDLVQSAALDGVEDKKALEQLLALGAHVEGDAVLATHDALA